MLTRSWMVALALTTAAACVADDIEHGAGDEDFPRRAAEAYCAALFVCDPLARCGYNSEPLNLEPPYASEAECVTHEQGKLEEVREAARAGGLRYDADCVDTTID